MILILTTATVVVAVLLGLIAGGYVLRNLHYAAWDARAVARAGFEEKQAIIDGSTVNYAEGPSNGPPLPLIHGQLTDWRSWNRVLPDLSREFRVFAVDCYGHGGSARVPERYRARALAADLEQFITEVIGEPVMIAGHSSGGLIAAGIAAEAPVWVTGLILEDPPFFSSVLPRAEKTFNYVDLSTTARDFLASGESDFTEYYIRRGAVWNLFKGAKEPVQRRALSYRQRHREGPVKVFFLPPAFNETLRALDQYDPRFGRAFWDNSFHADFDHAEVLRSIGVPTVLIHANWSYNEDGILLAAMDDEDAERARTLLPDVHFVRVDAGHGFHFEQPGRFVEITHAFQQQVDDRATSEPASPRGPHRVG